MSERKDKHFIKKPIYPGGNDAFKKFISDTLKYPKEALENKIEGTVVLKYAIDYRGLVSDIRVIKSLGYGCDEEAKRVISKLKFEVPKEPRKLRVLFHKETKIFFKLPVKKTSKKKSEQNTSYTYVPVKSESPKENKPGSYSYTIKW